MPGDEEGERALRYAAFEPTSNAHLAGCRASVGAKGGLSEAEKGKACVVRVVMNGSADEGPDRQPHIRNKDKRRKLAKDHDAATKAGQEMGLTDDERRSTTRSLRMAQQ